MSTWSGCMRLTIGAILAAGAEGSELFTAWATRAARTAGSELLPVHGARTVLVSLTEILMAGPSERAGRLPGPTGRLVD